MSAGNHTVSELATSLEGLNVQGVAAQPPESDRPSIVVETPVSLLQFIKYLYAFVQGYLYTVYAWIFKSRKFIVAFYENRSEGGWRRSSQE
jgi:hypothetical protein